MEQHPAGSDTLGRHPFLTVEPMEIFILSQAWDGVGSWDTTYILTSQSNQIKSKRKVSDLYLVFLFLDHLLNLKQKLEVK